GVRPPRVRVEARSVASYLESAAGGVDLAFIDPPYDLGEVELARDLSLLAPLLADAATVVVERSSRSPEPAWPDGIEPERRRDYGETTLWWAAATGPDQPAPPSQPE
ncbi:RsmD family RNA methyltransferase, partial [Agromyces binzhouensis]